MSLKTVEKLLSPSIEHIHEITAMSNEEKINYIKKKYGLTHGKGKKKRKKKNK